MNVYTLYIRLLSTLCSAGATNGHHLDLISSAADEEIRLQFCSSSGLVNGAADGAEAIGGAAASMRPVRDTPSPSKRHRSRTPRPHNIQRPCLDFEKMQQVRKIEPKVFYSLRCKAALRNMEELQPVSLPEKSECVCISFRLDLFILMTCLQLTMSVIFN